MTKKLYDETPYDTNFEATVLSCTACEQGYDIILDQTLFFPEEGGQSCDKGTINTIEVIDVQIDKDKIHHYTKEKVEGKITGQIDWKHRYSNMQNHSGEHVLSGIVHSLYGYNNSGFHLSENEITTDYDGFLTKEQIELVEQKANQVIFENHPIFCSYPENVDQINYRSKKEIEGPLRIVEIEGVDICACCAPHVRSTSEIGIIKIVKTMKFKKGIRLFFLCGLKAMEDYMLKHNQCTQISNQLSSPVEDCSKNVERILQENYHLKQTISSLKKENIDFKTSHLETKEFQIVFEKEIDKATQQYYFNILNEHATKLAAIFVENDDTYRFMMGSNQNANVYLNKLRKDFIVRGGGKDHFVQGTIQASKEDILQRLLESPF